MLKAFAKHEERIALCLSQVIAVDVSNTQPLGQQLRADALSSKFDGIVNSAQPSLSVLEATGKSENRENALKSDSKVPELALPEAWATNASRHTDFTQATSDTPKSYTCTGITESTQSDQEDGAKRDGNLLPAMNPALTPTSSHAGAMRWHVDEAMHEMERMSREIRNGSVWTKDGDGKLTCGDVLNQIVHNRHFELFISMLIVGNAIFIGIQVDFSMHHLVSEKSDPKRLLSHRAIDLIFTLLFSLELSLRIGSEGVRHFFSLLNRSLRWNLFDTGLVLMSILEEIVSLVSDQNIGGVSAIRLLRILRLIRIIRVIRVMRFFRDLRVLVQGIANSLKSLLWCAALLLVYMYIFSICVMQVVIDEFISHYQEPGDHIGPDTEHGQSLIFHYNSSWRCIYTLYMSISGGVDWGEVSEPLGAIHPIFTVLFCLYIAFTIFCILNIVTGVFVENAHKIVNDEEHMIMEDLHLRRHWFEEVLQVFKAADKDESGELTFQEFSKHVSDLRVQAYFRKVGINIESDSANSLFQLLDFDQNGKVNVDEFVLGCTKFGGAARGVDIARLRHDNGILKKELIKLETRFEHFEVKFTEIMERLLSTLFLPGAKNSFTQGNEHVKPPVPPDSQHMKVRPHEQGQFTEDVDWLPGSVGHQAS